MEAVFDTLNALNINEHTEKKKTGSTELTYLSWPWAWAEVKKRYPGAQYRVWKDVEGRPYTYDSKTGFMVYTEVEIDGVCHEMWLPVMDSHNAAMKDAPYEVKTKYNSYTVAAATMFDINKTIMRCLVKNLAMFGLGLYIYAGEDLPESEQEEPKAKDTCARCAKKIKPMQGKDGEMPVPAVISYSLQKFGAVYCGDCMKLLFEKSKKAKSES